MPVSLRAVDDAEELLLELLCHRTAVSLADCDAVNRADRRNLGSRSREEHLIGDVEQLPRHNLLDYRYPELSRQRHNGVAGDARQHGGAERRSNELAVSHKKNV